MEHVDTVVIGGGQAGLSAGHHLARRGRDFVILEAADRIGHSWRSRWDSLRLFTPARFSHLPGLPCPAQDGRYHGKDEIADYLERYAARFSLPVSLGSRVEQLARDGGRYLVSTAGQTYEASNVVVATGAFTTPYIPAVARRLSPAITQLHSTSYRNPEQLRSGPALVVGAGNSGAEIALEIAGSHPTLLSGRDPGHVPFPLGNLTYRLMQQMRVSTWPGRAIAAAQTGRGHPLIHLGPRDIKRAGIRRVPRVVDVAAGLPVLEDGRTLDVRNVIWCTGFTSDYPWLKLPVLGSGGRPRHDRGVVGTEPGLYFLGLPFQATVTSHLVGGVGADAAYIVRAIAERS